MEHLSLAAAFMLGLLGAGHCIGMCGGIMAALSMGKAGHNPRSGRSVAIVLGYNLGRILSYALIGFLMGALGWFIGGFSRETSIGLRIFAGIMLIVMGLYLGGWWTGLTQLEKAGHTLWKRIQPKASALLPIDNPFKAIAVGAVWGWLPCGLIYSTLIWAASSSDALYSAGLMLAFGLGTLPVMVLTGLLARQLQTVLQSRLFRSGAATLVILFGAWTIPGPHQMWVMSKLSLSSGGHMHHHSGKASGHADMKTGQKHNPVMQHSDQHDQMSNKTHQNTHKKSENPASMQHN